MLEAVSAVLHAWHRSKLALEGWLPVSHDLLHAAAGLAVWLAAATVLRKPISSWTPMVAVTAIALFNEAVDLWVERWPDPVQQFGEGARDFAVTLLLPLALMGLSRWRPQLFRRS